MSGILWIVALKDIQAGEALTDNYGYELDDEPPEPCHCCTLSCGGYILGEAHWHSSRVTLPCSEERFY